VQTIGVYSVQVGSSSGRVEGCDVVTTAMKGMVRVTGGRFRMGSTDYYLEERPVHEVEIGDFWIDDHPVTNAEFRRFVRATGHVTVGERSPNPADFPGAQAADLVPGSLVFADRQDRFR
jgi:formylglycine-generating enzyme